MRTVFRSAIDDMSETYVRAAFALSERSTQYRVQQQEVRMCILANLEVITRASPAWSNVYFYVRCDARIQSSRGSSNPVPEF